MTRTSDLTTGASTTADTAPRLDPAITYLEGDDGVILDRSTTTNRGRAPKAKDPTPTSQDRARTRLNTPTRRDWPYVKMDDSLLTRLAARLSECGLDERAAAITAALEEAAAIQVAPATDYSSHRDALAKDIADHTLTVEEATAKLIDAARAGDAETVAAQLLLDAREHIIRDAGRHLYDLGDTIIEELDQVVQQEAENAVEASLLCAGIAEDKDAARTTGAGLAGWQALTASRVRTDNCHRLADALRTHQLAPDLPLPAIPAVYYQWRNVDAVQAAHLQDLHPNWVLVNLIESGAQPAVLTAAEVIERYVL